jgi:hypothetical protein
MAAVFLKMLWTRAGRQKMAQVHRWFRRCYRGFIRARARIFPARLGMIAGRSWPGFRLFAGVPAIRDTH